MDSSNSHYRMTIQETTIKLAWYLFLDASTEALIHVHNYFVYIMSSFVAKIPKIDHSAASSWTKTSINTSKSSTVEDEESGKLDSWNLVTGPDKGGAKSDKNGQRQRIKLPRRR